MHVSLTLFSSSFHLFSLIHQFNCRAGYSCHKAAQSRIRRSRTRGQAALVALFVLAFG